jgi:dCMP deaminase
MTQCKATTDHTITPSGPIQCVLEDGHPSVLPDSHNFGGLGPYSKQRVLSVNRLSWDETWLALAHGIAKRSLCSRDQVGAVIVSQDNTPLMASYNGPPSGFLHNDQPCTEWCSRARIGNQTLSPVYDDCPALHAEANAISRSSHLHRKGGTIYVTSDVCFNCAKVIANSGITRIVVDRRQPREYRNSARSYEFLTISCGLIVSLVTEHELPADYWETAQ